MAKIRVHELAKEFNLSGKEIAEKIKALGYPIKGYMSTLEDYEISEIKRKLQEKTESLHKSREESKPDKVIRRRPKKVHIKIVESSGVEEAEDVPSSVVKPDSQGELVEEKGQGLDTSVGSSFEEEREMNSRLGKNEVEELEGVDETAVFDGFESQEKSVQPDSDTPVQREADDSVKVKEPRLKSEASEKPEISSEEEKQKTPPADYAFPRDEVKSRAEFKVVSEPEVVSGSEVATSDEMSKKKSKKVGLGNGAERISEGDEKIAKKPVVKEEEKPKSKKVKGGRKKKIKGEGEAPRQFAKILDRKIELPQAQSRTQPRTQTKAQAKQQKPAGTKPVRPKKDSSAVKDVGISDSGVSSPEEVITPSSGKGRKKGKRVVHSAELDGGRKRKIETKKGGGKRKTIDTILAEEEGLPGRRRKSKKTTLKEEVQSGTAPIKTEKRKFAIYETIQPVELAKKMGVKVGEVIMKLMGLGVMATATQSIDFDTAVLVASDFDYEVEKAAVAEDIIEIEDSKAGGETVARPPVVTVMGHVDHGKTSLLDAIRNADVASGEAGGITQHIGAYEVKLESGGRVVFLDTPGHEAFTSMRARGASVTDIVIIVVAADDGVMAQTREAIDHSRAAGVPIIVAVNKIDKPGADPDRVKRELSEQGLVPEDWGGDTIFVNVSAKEGTGIEELLELMTLQAEILELSAVPDRPAKGHVIESRLDKGRGAVATLLVQEGTLKVGDALVCGLHYGKIRAMINDRGERVENAGPSIPVEIQGLSGVPEAGNEFIVLPDERKARDVAEYRQTKSREAELVRSNRVSLDSLFQKMKEDELKTLKLLVKADVQGSLEAFNDALVKLSTDKIKVEIVRGGIGAVTESDVLLASASEAIIIGFNVKPGMQAKQLAEHEHVDIRFYDVIYHALEEIKSAMAGLLEPVFKEIDLGRAEVRDTFHISRVGTIAGCHVIDGVIRRNASVRLLRDNVVVYNGKIISLKRFKDDAKEVQSGYECGIGLERFNDIKAGDVIEAYELEEVAPDLGISVQESQETGEEKNGSGGN